MAPMNAPTTQLQDRPQATYQPSTALARVLARLPQDIRAGLTAEQLAELDGALDFEDPAQHLVNLRVTLFGWAYLTILGGRERRSPARRVEERKRHPLRSPGNIAFLVGVAILGLVLGNTLHALLFGG